VHSDCPRQAVDAWRSVSELAAGGSRRVRGTPLPAPSCRIVS